MDAGWKDICTYLGITDLLGTHVHAATYIYFNITILPVERRFKHDLTFFSLSDMCN